MKGGMARESFREYGNGGELEKSTKNPTRDYSNSRS